MGYRISGGAIKLCERGRKWHLTHVAFLLCDAATMRLLIGWFPDTRYLPQYRNLSIQAPEETTKVRHHRDRFRSSVLLERF